jgi:hypothetical protein
MMQDHKLESREFFDKIASRYDRHPQGRQSQRLYQRVVAMAKAWGFKSITDTRKGW